MWEVRSSCEIVNCTKGKTPFRLLVAIAILLNQSDGLRTKQQEEAVHTGCIGQNRRFEPHR